MNLPVHPRGYVCVKSPHQINIAGDLSDDAWKLARWSEDFVDIEGKETLKPWFKTRMKMLWDDEFLYIAAELEEPHLWATLKDHDSVIFHDHDFEVFIDPDGDNHQYYEYEINAFGTDWDLRLVKPYRDGGPALNEWEIPGLRKAIALNGTINNPKDTDKGWTIELAFPWKVLGEYAQCDCPPKVGQQWRINFSRVEWDLRVVAGQYQKVPDHAEHNWVWSSQGAIDMHRPEMWGYVQFENEPKPFIQDPNWEARCQLMKVYWAQRDYLKEHGQYAESVTDLGLEFSGIRIGTNSEGYMARLRVKEGHLSVRQDSLISKTSSRNQLQQ